MIKTEKIKCPHCHLTQGQDIHDLTEGGYLEGSFPMLCEHCLEEFTVEYSYVSYIGTKKTTN